MTHIFETDTETFFETKVFETDIETFFRDQIFSRPIPRLFFYTKYFRDRDFFRDQNFRDRYRDFFLRPNIFETDTETFFRDQLFLRLILRLFFETETDTLKKLRKVSIPRSLEARCHTLQSRRLGGPIWSFAINT